MVNITIVQKDDPVLRRIAQEVPREEIQSKKVQGIIAQMKQALVGEKDGVAIAAPQIGEPFRIFIVAGKIFNMAQSEEEGRETDAVFINPKIVKFSRKKVGMDEGCLSVRHWYGKVRRAEKVTIRAYDERGKQFERGGSGLLAQIFQHETDHLDGILFIDKAKDLQEIKPDEHNEKKL